MIDEKKLIESINNLINWMNNEAKTKSDEDVIAGLKVVLAFIDEQAKIGEWIWISVEERLPEESDVYLVKTEDGEIFKCSYEENPVDLYGTGDNCKWRDTNYCPVYDVVAWRPLPEPYKEETDG